MPPPLQDITRRFVSPLPPSSPPALSYIDDEDPDQQDRAKPSSAFLGLSTSSNVLHIRPIAEADSTSDKENKGNLPPPEIENDFERHLKNPGPSNAIFSTPKAKARRGGDERSPPSSDPFGFLAVERKLKLQRKQAKHMRDDAHQLAEPKRKRQKLDSTAPSQMHVARPLYRTPAKITLGHGTQTPLNSDRHTIDIRTLSPPAATPFHQKGRKRRRSTLAFDEGNNPFLDSHPTTPSPSKRHRASVDDDGDNGLTFDDYDAFLSPTSKKAGLPMAATSPIRRRRKRPRLGVSEADEDVVDIPNETLSVLAGDPDALANALRSRLPKKRGMREENVGQVTPVQKKKLKAEEIKSRSKNAVDKVLADDPDALASTLRSRLPKKRETREESVAPVQKKSRLRRAVGEAVGEAVGKDKDKNRIDDEANQGEKRRSARLAKRDPFDKTIKTTRKAKGKENAGKKTAVRVTAKRTSSNTKGKEKCDDVPDDVAETRERERAARLAYFKKLESYELETENIYVI